MVLAPTVEIRLLLSKDYVCIWLNVPLVLPGQGLRVGLPAAGSVSGDGDGGAVRPGYMCS